MEENKKQVRSIFNGAPVANPARRSAAMASARPVARPAGTAPTASPRPVAGSAGTATKVAAPIAKPVAKTAPVNATASQPRASQGATQPLNASPKIGQAQSTGTTAVADSSKKQEKTASAKKDNKKTKLWLGVCGGVLIVAVIIAIVVVLLNNNGGQQGSGEDELDDNTNAIINGDSEEVKRVTDETMGKYAEVNVEGYKDMEGEDASGKAVIVTVKNVSEETVSLAITIGAYDHEGNLLDTSSVYAEGIGPGQTSRFNAFVFTELTPEQLGSAEYKVYTANTYETPWAEGGEETVNAGEEVVQLDEGSVQENPEVSE